MSGERRFRKAYVTPELICAWFATGNRVDGFVVESGIPEGAVIVGCGMRDISGDLFILLEHSSFEPVKEGDQVPALQILCGREAA